MGNYEVRIQVIIIVIVFCCMQLCCVCVFLPGERFRHNVRASVWVILGSVRNTGKIIILVFKLSPCSKCILFLFG